MQAGNVVIGMATVMPTPQAVEGVLVPWAARRREHAS